MKYQSLVIAVALVAGFGITGCATQSSSNAAPASMDARWTGPILVSPAQLPEAVKHKVIGTVQADAQCAKAGVRSQRQGSGLDYFHQHPRLHP